MAKTSAPEITGPVWSEHSRLITVQAYKVEEAERVITINGTQDVAPGNYVVNEGGFLSIVSADEFEGLYPEEATPTDIPATVPPASVGTADAPVIADATIPADAPVVA